MTDIDADPLNPRVYFQSCIDQLRHDVAEIRRRGACGPRDTRGLADAEREIVDAEAELASIRGAAGVRPA